MCQDEEPNPFCLDLCVNCALLAIPSHTLSTGRLCRASSRPERIVMGPPCSAASPFSATMRLATPAIRSLPSTPSSRHSLIVAETPMKHAGSKHTNTSIGQGNPCWPSRDASIRRFCLQWACWLTNSPGFDAQAIAALLGAAAASMMPTTGEC